MEIDGRDKGLVMDVFQSLSELNPTIGLSNSSRKACIDENSDSKVTKFLCHSACEKTVNQAGQNKVNKSIEYRVRIGSNSTVSKSRTYPKQKP